MAKIVKNLQNEEWEIYSKHLDKIKTFEERLKEIKESLLLHYELEEWPITQINDTSLSFTRDRVSYE